MVSFPRVKRENCEYWIPKISSCVFLWRQNRGMVRVCPSQQLCSDFKWCESKEEIKEEKKCDPELVFVI
jgi:hypothetical protein